MRTTTSSYQTGACRYDADGLGPVRRFNSPPLRLTLLTAADFYVI